MSQRIDTRPAIAILAGFGYTKPKIAAEVGVSLRTVQRWAAGRHSPSAKGLTALRVLVGQLIMYVSADQPSPAQRRRAARLETAAEALLTERERQERAELAARARRPVTAQSRAERLAAAHRAIETRPVRPPFRSTTADVDPFELCVDRHSREAEAIDVAVSARDTVDAINPPDRRRHGGSPRGRRRDPEWRPPMSKAPRLSDRLCDATWNHGKCLCIRRDGHAGYCRCSCGATTEPQPGAVWPSQPR